MGAVLIRWHERKGTMRGTGGRGIGGVRHGGMGAEGIAAGRVEV